MSESAVEKLLKEWRERDYAPFVDAVEKAIAEDKAVGLPWDTPTGENQYSLLCRSCGGWVKPIYIHKCPVRLCTEQELMPVPPLFGDMGLPWRVEEGLIWDKHSPIFEHLNNQGYSARESAAILAWVAACVNYCGSRTWREAPDHAPGTPADTGEKGTEGADPGKRS